MAPQRYPRGCAPLPRRTILLVEDEPFVRDATSRILRNAGFEVLPAADAQEAIQAYDRSGRKVDLLMTDVVLPGRSGYQLVQDLRCRAPATPVLLTSGYGEVTIGSGVSDATTHYLAKPYSRQTLLETIEEILGAGALPAAQGL